MPSNDFSALRLSPSLIRVAQELGFKELTPIQAQSIPRLLNGEDLIGQAKTGSGKTAAFTFPILEKIDLGSRSLQAMILCPTRELCSQVAREVRKLGRYHSGLQVLVLSGGQPMFAQLKSLSQGVHIVVGTPGRVLDHLSRGSLALDQVATVVLDEADRMLDMGFQEDMERILGEMPESRQTVFFSATFPRSIDSMSRAFQRNPVRVTIEEAASVAPTIRQVVYEANPELKLKALLWVLQQNQHEAAIVFCNLKTTVIELSNALSRAGVSAACLHGDMEQRDRDRVMAKFRNQSTRLLIATDVAARGIDIENLDIVICYDLPAQAEVYVHRIGRTGRAGKRGFAISLATSREAGKIQAIEKITGVPLIRKTLANVEGADAESLARDLNRDARMATLFISGGRKEKMRPGDILGALTGEAGRMTAAQIGKIEIHDHFSYVAVSKEFAQTALARLNQGRIKGRKFRVELVR